MKELSYYVRKCKTKYILVHHNYLKVATELKEYMARSFDSKLGLVNLRESIFNPPLALGDILISSDRALDGNAAALVIFTSGTTGPPKGAVLRRNSTLTGSLDLIETYQIQPLDTVMHCLPVHHATGLQLTFTPFLLAGGCVEFHSRFDVRKTWKRWGQGGLAFFSGVPTIYTRMMQFYEDEMNKPVPASAEPFFKAASQFKGLLCGTSALPRSLMQKWLVLTGGQRILERYGGSEFGAVYVMPRIGTLEVPDVSVHQDVGTKYKLI